MTIARHTQHDSGDESQPSSNSLDQPVLKAVSNDESTDGHIPADLRDWMNEKYPAADLLQSLDEVDTDKCRELAEFLDLEELSRAVTREQSDRQR